MQSKATTVDQYFAELPPDRRAALQIVREMFRKNIDKNYEEGMGYGMPGYYVPHRVYPPGYHCDPKQPLPFAGFASQKNYMSIYLMCVYGGSEEETRFRAAWAKTGKKLDMGKCCIRFKKIEDVALDVIADTIRRIPAKAYVERYESIRQGSTTSKTSSQTTPAKSPAKSRALVASKSALPAKTSGKASKSSGSWTSTGPQKSSNTGRRGASAAPPRRSRSGGR